MNSFARGHPVQMDMVTVKAGWVQIEDPDGHIEGLMNRCYVRKDQLKRPLFAIDIIRNNAKTKSQLYLKKTLRGEWVKQDDVPAGLLSEYVEMMGIAKAKLDAEHAFEEEINARRT